MNRRLKATKDRIETLFEFWRAQLGLDWLTIAVGYSEGELAGEPSTCATTTALWQYRDASLMFYLPACALLDDDELERVVVHELVHVLNNPIETHLKGREEHIEFAAESVTRAIMHAVRPL